MSADPEQVADCRPAPDEVDTALDRILLSTALGSCPTNTARWSAGRTTRAGRTGADRRRPADPGRHREIPAALRGPRATAQPTGNGGDSMTVVSHGWKRDDDRYSTWDAAYVLGALSGAERREYEGHLAGCARCRSAVAELSGMPGLLAMLDLDEVSALDDEQPDPPLRPEVLQACWTRSARAAARPRWLTSAAVGLAAALLAVGTGHRDPARKRSACTPAPPSRPAHRCWR